MGIWIKKILAATFLSPAGFALGPLLCLILLFHAYVNIYLSRTYGDRGKAYEVKEIKHNGFKLRVTANYETGVIFPGAYQSLYSAIGNDEWREIMWIKTDGEPPIPNDLVHFVSDRFAYAFFRRHSKLAVTIDGGNSWFVWDAEKDFVNRPVNSTTGIGSVMLGADGTGRLKLIPVPGQKDDYSDLQSSDFGRHWK